MNISYVIIEKLPGDTYKSKNFGQFFTLKVGVDLYAGVKICSQLSQ